MNARSAVKCAITALAAIGLVASTAAVSRAQTTSDLVYLALSKNVFEGQGKTKLAKMYKCAVPPGSANFKEMKKLSLPLTLPFKAHDCDEDGHDGKISTTWTVLLRTPPAAGGVHFGTHNGGGTYLDTAGNTIRVSFSGTVGCGTHRDPFADCEKCRVDKHFEGLLTGTYTAGPVYNVYIGLGLPAPKIRATYAGQIVGDWPSPQVPSTAVFVRMAIDGVYIFNCKP